MSLPFVSRGAALLLAGSLLLTACQSGSSDKAARSTSGAPATAVTPAAPAADSPGTWYRQYRTLLPGSPADSITVHLQRLGPTPADEGPTAVVGFYSGAAGQPFELSGSMPAPDSLLLRDVDASLLDADSNGPVWRLRRQGTAWVGTRAGQPVRLRLQLPPQGAALASRLFTDSIPARPNQPTDSIYGHVSLHTLVPAPERTALAASLLNALRGDTLDTKPTPTLAALWQEQRRSFAQLYQEEVGSILAQCAADTSGYCPSATLRYQEQASTCVLWNDDRLLSVGLFSYTYAGGAHGMYSTRVLSLDARTGRALRYVDIFRPGSEAQLERLLNRHARLALGLKPGAPLSEALHEDTLPLTRNVYLTSGGAVFVYPPYAVAAFALGEIRVFVPLAELRPLLQPGLPVGRGEVAGR